MASEEDTKLLAYMKELGVPPMKDKDDLKRFMTEFGASSTESSTSTYKVKTQVNSPRISIFFGEEGKGEVSYDTWAYEVKCLHEGKVYPEEVLLQAIRRSLRGHAADQLRYLGIKTTIDEILHEFESTYGTVDTVETILKKFYACQQSPGESVMNFCIRLENIHAKAVEMEALRTSDDMLRRVFYKGLNPQLKHLVAFKFETVKNYLDFKKEVRQIENELTEEAKSQIPTEQKTCHAANKKQNDSDNVGKTEKQLNELTALIQALNSRLDNLEKKQDSTSCNQQQTFDNEQQGAMGMQEQIPQQFNPNDTFYRNPQQFNYRPMGWRGQKHVRGPSSYRPRGQGPFRGQGRGQESYRIRTPSAGNNFRPLECYACHGQGHLARDCPSYQDPTQRTCFNCNEPGHKARDCQKTLNK